MGKDVPSPMSWFGMPLDENTHLLPLTMIETSPEKFRPVFRSVTFEVYVFAYVVQSPERLVANALVISPPVTNALSIADVPAGDGLIIGSVSEVSAGAEFTTLSSSLQDIKAIVHNSAASSAYFMGLRFALG